LNELQRMQKKELNNPNLPHTNSGIILSPTDNDAKKAQMFNQCIEQFSCALCQFYQFCKVSSVELKSKDIAAKRLQQTRLIEKRTHLYQQNDICQALYIVTSGSFKSYSTQALGRNRITGFHFLGEIMGLGGMSGEGFDTSAKALEDSTVCEFPLAEIERISLEFPQLKFYLLKAMSQEMIKYKAMLTFLGNCTAHEKVARFLLELSHRVYSSNSHGMSDRNTQNSANFSLPMTYADLGNYLGLTVETVSRVMSYLREQNVLSIKNKKIEISDKQKLQELIRPLHS